VIILLVALNLYSESPFINRDPKLKIYSNQSIYIFISTLNWAVISRIFTDPSYMMTSAAAYRERCISL